MSPTTTATAAPAATPDLEEASPPPAARPATRRAHDGALPRPGIGYLLPALAVFGVFALLPLIGVAALSFTSWNGLGNPAFNGLDNWQQLFANPATWSSLKVTLILTALGWLLQTPLALLLGVWAAGTQRLRAVFSALYFLPLLLSGAAVALVWKALLDPTFGLSGQLGSWFGSDGDFLSSPSGALACVLAVGAWQFVPFHMLMYQAAARNVPAQLYEAATLDGAGRVRQFFAITLPQLRNTVVTSSTLMVVGSMTTFETILILTNGGPGTATQILPFRMYQQAFMSFEMGPAAALATVLVLFGTGLSLLIVRFSGFTKMNSTLEGI
ncbi:carbohydrate ABC transporter permease [Streptomyces endophyticus]|uniref:Sugar ABC transporter permease n=1 Tax=Streptomyces endophyticus TaxID=714166 RepID=A0ABU6F2I0_9ACTN|nr:sugar ABC transporter permease [Streptomyces endophyticus]MEB8338225.1 sugar ABC transporter permease [Streptomyces endophyticus]